MGTWNLRSLCFEVAYLPFLLPLTAMVSATWREMTRTMMKTRINRSEFMRLRSSWICGCCWCSCCCCGSLVMSMLLRFEQGEAICRSLAWPLIYKKTFAKKKNDGYNWISFFLVKSCERMNVLEKQTEENESTVVELACFAAADQKVFFKIKKKKKSW